MPKNEWDVAAGVALLRFAQGHLLTTEGLPPTFNRKNPLFPGLVGFSAAGLERLRPFLKSVLDGNEFRDCFPWALPLATLDCGMVEQDTIVVNRLSIKFGRRAGSLALISLKIVIVAITRMDRQAR